MASLINNLNKEWIEKEKEYKSEILELKQQIEILEKKYNKNK